MKMKEDLERAILETPSDVADKVDTEVKLMSNRVRAIKLVLSMECSEGEGVGDFREVGDDASVQSLEVSFVHNRRKLGLWLL